MKFLIKWEKLFSFDCMWDVKCESFIIGQFYVSINFDISAVYRCIVLYCTC